jgi:hypothetical protein
VTDQCVAHAVKDAADLGYLVTLVTGEGLCRGVVVLRLMSIEYNSVLGGHAKDAAESGLPGDTRDR